MDQLLAQLLSASFIFLSIGLYIPTFMVRIIFENIFKNLPSKWWWSNLLLILLPIFVGIIFGIVAKFYPFPDNLTTTSGRIICSGVAGLFSGLMYRITKTLIKNLLGTYIQNNINKPQTGIEGSGLPSYHPQ